MKPIHSRSIAALICLQCFTVSPRDAQAFYVDGFGSGMSMQQFALAASAQGLAAQPDEAGYFYLAAGSPPLLLARVGFCENILVSYSRNIQSDSDYARVLAHIFSEYGPPSRMQFSGDVEPGIAAGAFRATGLTLWEKGPDRVSMDSSFDWRLYQGHLYRQQPASVSFQTFNPCNF